MSRSASPGARKGASKLIADFVGTLGTRVGTMGIGLFTGILSARLLGPEDRGIFALVALFPSTLVTLTKFGQAQAVIYFIRREKVDVATIASNAVTFGVMVGAALVALVLGFREQLVSSVLGGVPVWALDSAALDGPLGIRTSREGEPLGGSADAPLLPQGRLVVADSAVAVAVLFGELAPTHAPHARAAEVTLFAVQVAGVPTLYVEEALWSSRLALEAP